LAAKPESSYARRAGFLYEWLTGERLVVEVPAKTRFVPALDETLQFGLGGGARDTRFRVIDNLPGSRDFCPLVRKTPYLQAMASTSRLAPARPWPVTMPTCCAGPPHSCT
jgi:hypothetical protein